LLGGFLAIAAVALATDISHVPLVLGSFGASCVLIFGFPESPFSQPRNAIGGHFLSSLIGLLFLIPVRRALVEHGTCSRYCNRRHATHPHRAPRRLQSGDRHAVGSSWSFLLTPTLIGSIIVVLVAIVFNNIPKERSYPKYWL